MAKTSWINPRGVTGNKPNLPMVGQRVLILRGGVELWVAKLFIQEVDITVWVDDTLHLIGDNEVAYWMPLEAVEKAFPIPIMVDDKLPEIKAPAKEGTIPKEKLRRAVDFVFGEKDGEE